MNDCIELTIQVFWSDPFFLLHVLIGSIRAVIPLLLKVIVVAALRLVAANSSCDNATTLETRLAQQLVELSLLHRVVWAPLHQHLSLAHLDVFAVANLVVGYTLIEIVVGLSTHVTGLVHLRLLLAHHHELTRLLALALRTTVAASVSTHILLTPRVVILHVVVLVTREVLPVVSTTSLVLRSLLLHVVLVSSHLVISSLLRLLELLRCVHVVKSLLLVALVELLCAFWLLMLRLLLLLLLEVVTVKSGVAFHFICSKWLRLLLLMLVLWLTLCLLLSLSIVVEINRFVCKHSVLL